MLKPDEHFDNKKQCGLSSLNVVGDLSDSDAVEIQHTFDIIDISEKEPARNILQKLSSPQKKPIFLRLSSINIPSGQPSRLSASRSFLYIQKTIQLLKENPNSSLLTLPVSKEWIIKSGTPFVGHTEVLKKVFKQKTWMCMYHPEMSVILLTNHIPLKKVSSQIKKINFNDLALALLFFQTFFRPTKPMAFLGLNPHAGEGGKIGKEESILKKKLYNIKKQGIPIKGIFPADGFFTPHHRKHYSLAIACYHDQGLIPFKALYGTHGINITLNLPQLRVSPDHGPAYSLAEQGNADINSVLKSLNFCLERGESWIKHCSYPLLHG